MADGDDLPDHDYESIYGSKAVWERRFARMEASARQHDAFMERMRESWRQTETPDLPYHPEHYTYGVMWVASEQRYLACVAEFPQLSTRGFTLAGTLQLMVDHVTRYLREQVATGAPLPPPRDQSPR